MPNSEEDSSEFKQLLSKLDFLEKRILNIEGKLGIHYVSPLADDEQGDSENEIPTNTQSRESLLESNVGGYGLALIGNIVLSFGIAFLSQYIQKLGYPLFSVLFGYIAVTLFFVAAHYLRKTIVHLSSMFTLFGQFLLYYITLRLHFFTDNPVIDNLSISLALLLAVIASQVYIAIKNKSELYADIALILTLVTASVSGTTHFMLALPVLVSAIAVYLFFHFGWRRTIIVSLFGVYLTFVIWTLKNQELLNPVTYHFLHRICNLYLLLCAMVFSFITLVPPKEMFSRNFIFSAVLLNGMFFSLVLMLFVFSFFQDHYISLFVVISIFCILFAILLKMYSAWKFSPAFYAMYGFVSISVAVYGMYKLPESYFLLSIQSLLVLSMALWFRSRIIVGLNAVLFLMLLLTYLVGSESVNNINFSFAIVAFATARIINWKKELLSITTNYLRNGYLVVVFCMLLFSLYKSVPAQYITLSWAITAIVYFVLSMILHNVKYRLMAIFTLIAAAFYLFMVDLSRISLAYRIIAFLVLAIISISISIYYNYKDKNKADEKGTT